MTVTARSLFNPVQAANAETVMYTAPAAGKGTILDKFTGTNTTGSAATLTVKLVQSGGGAGVANTIVVKSLAAGEAYTFPEITGHVLNAGDFISVLAGTASAVTIRASGREVT